MMTIQRILGSTTAALCLVAIASQTAQAGTLHQGWNYAIDSFNDGTERHIVGHDSAFEFYGMAYREVGDKVYFAFNSNLALDGYTDREARNGKISYGDLFLDFSNLGSFNSANGGLLGIRFDATNDTQVGVGLYGNVTATTVTTANAGYATMQKYRDAVQQYGGAASYGDLAETTPYFNQKQAAPTIIASGESLGGISSIITDFGSLNLDFGHFGAVGTYTFGFSIDRNLLPNGDFIAALFAECGNDGMALTGHKTPFVPDEPATVPEPSGMVGLLALGTVFAGHRLRQYLLKG